MATAQWALTMNEMGWITIPSDSRQSGISETN